VNSYRGAEKEWVDLDTADHTGAELVVYLYDTTGGGGGVRPSGYQGTGTGHVRSIDFPQSEQGFCDTWGY
jgi:hypothetical protein